MPDDKIRDAAALEAAAGLIDTKGLGQPNTVVNQADPNTGTPPVVDDKTGKPASVAAPAAPVVNQPIKVDTPFGSQTFGATGGPVLSSFEDVQAFGKEHGYDLKNVDDIRQLFTSVADLRKEAAEVPNLQAAVNTYKSQLGSLPPEIVNLVDTALAGKDYRSVIKAIASGVGVDLSKSFVEHDTIGMLQRYADPGINKEKYDELSDGNKEALVTIARSKYESDQASWKTSQVDNTRAKQEFSQKFDQSIQAALQTLKAQFPDMGEANFKVVADRMAYGMKDSLFNADNTYKADAAVKVAMQEFGVQALQAQKQTIGDLARKAYNQIESKTNEQLLIRGDKPDLQGRKAGDDSNVVTSAVDQATKFLSAR